MTFLGFFGNRSKAFLIATAFVSAGLAGWIDYRTGHDYSVVMLYLVPVYITAWFVGKTAAIAASFVCAAAWIAAETIGQKQYDDRLALYWNDLMELGFFLLVSIILTSLKASLDHQKTIARTDSLTGVSNRRYFYELVDSEINRLRRYDHPFTVAYIDLDNFKFVNDNFGHSAGDDLLQQVVGVLKKSVRATDRIARLGGDEFALLLPETPHQPAAVVMEKVRNVMQQAVEKKRYPVTLSIGMATFYSPPETVDQVMEQVDTLMYAVKKSGRNRVLHEVVEKEGTYGYTLSGGKELKKCA